MLLPRQVVGDFVREVHVLSVDRDCRFNTKAVKMTFDIKDIATYDADCRTVTIEAYGGTMGEP